MHGTHHAKSTVRAGAVAICTAFAIQRGIPIHELTEMCGLDETDLMQPDARLDARVLARLWRNLELRFPGQLLALKMCRVAPLTLAGDIPHGAQFANNLGDVLRLFGQNATLLGDSLEIEVVRIQEPDEAHVTITHPLDAFTFGTLTELRLGFAWRLLSEFASGPIRLRRVAFAHRANGAMEDYERHFGCEVRFEQPSSALVLPPAVLETPTSQASADLFAFARSYLERSRVRLAGETVQTELQRLLQAIRTCAASGCFDSSTVATAAGMSLRTAQRISCEEGPSLGERISSIRADLAREALLDARMSVASVARLLGYADCRSFRRAFRNWTGLTPSEFREQHS
jgi:AraC-like DNA-binding protein